MTVTFETCCPQCNTYYSVARSHLGHYGKCMQCQTDFLLTENASLHMFGDREIPTLIPFDSKHIVKSQAASLSQAIESTPKEMAFSSGAGTWNVGDVILGTYEVRELAHGKAYAEGGLGVVHRIWHREWELELAVKSPKAHVLVSDQGKTSYEQEALHWLHLELHPNIVSCYMVRRIDDIPRLFAEFVTGGSLWDWIVDGRLYQGGVDVSRRRVMDMLIQFAWGIQHAHHQNILHLDIKPGNIMIDGSALKVTDFGLSVRFSEEKPSGENPNSNVPQKAPSSITKLVGLTPHYCSPEQHELYMALSRRQEYEGYQVGIQSDIWSFAVTALAMLKGQTPGRSGPDARESLEDLIRRGAPPERPAMSEGLPELLLQCLELDPTNRPTSMKTIAAQLIEIYQNDFSEKYHRTPPEQLTLNVDTLNNRAASLIDLGKTEEAEDVFREAETIQPWHPLVTYNSMLHSWRSGRISDSDAAALMETLTQMHTQSEIAWYAKGLVQRERGDIWIALSAFEKSLEFAERIDVRRSYEATSPLILSCVKLIRNITIPPDRFVDIYLAEKQNLLLIKPEKSELQLRGILDDDADIFFVQQENSESDSIGITQDNQWQIRKEQDTLRLNRVGIDKTRCRFRRVIWETLYSKANTNSFWVTEIFDETKVRLRHRFDDEIAGVLEADTEPVTAVVASRKGHWVITGSRDGKIRLWETPRGRCVRTISTSNAAVEGLFLSPCESFLLVITRDGSLSTIDISLLTQHTSRCRAPYLLSVMTSIESAGRIQTEIKETTLSLNEAITENSVTRSLENLARLQQLPGWEATRRSLGCDDYFYRNAKRFAPQESVCTHSFGCVDRVSTVALSRDAQILIASGRDPVLHVWKFNESNVAHSFEGHTDWVRSVVITADAKFAISGSWDGTVRLWNLATGRTVRVMPAPLEMISQIALDHSGRYLIVANDMGDVKVWGMASNTIVAEWFSPLRKVMCLAVSRDDKYIAIGGEGGKIAIYDWHIKHVTHEFTVGSEQVTALALTSDMSHAIVGDVAGKLITWHIQDRYPRARRDEHRHPITSIRLLKDDLWFIASSQDRTISTHHLVDSRHKVLAWHSAGINTLALDASEKHLVSGAEDGIVRMRELYWDFTARREEDELPMRRVLRAIITSYKNAHAEIAEINDATYAAIGEEMSYRGFAGVTRGEIDEVFGSIK